MPMSDKKVALMKARSNRVARAVFNPPRKEQGSIPRFNAFPILNQVFEFKCAGAQTNTITMGQIRKLIVFAATATSALFPIDTFRIKLIQAYGLPTTNVFGTINFEWTGTREKGVVAQDQGTPFKMASLTMRPTPNSDTSKWQTVNEDANSCFTYNSLGADILRIHLEYTMGNTVTVLSVTGTGATVGCLNFNILSTSLPSTSKPAVTTVFT